MSLFPAKHFVQRSPASLTRSRVLIERGGESRKISDEAALAEASITLTLDIDCSKAQVRPPFTSQSKNLRLRTKGCAVEKVVNHRNGFDASIFETNDMSYTSDYISLADGENQLRLEGKSRSGEDVLIEFTVFYQ